MIRDHICDPNKIMGLIGSLNLPTIFKSIHQRETFKNFLSLGCFMGPVCFFCMWLKVKYPALGKKKTLGGRHQLLIREKHSDPTLTTLSSPRSITFGERENLLKYIIL